MKKSSPLVSAVLACAMALALVTNVSAQEVKQLKAKVIRVSGHARFTTGNNVWQPLKVGDTLRAGYRYPNRKPERVICRSRYR